jgi:hypothetical protein
MFLHDSSGPRTAPAPSSPLTPAQPAVEPTQQNSRQTREGPSNPSGTAPPAGSAQPKVPSAAVNKVATTAGPAATASPKPTPQASAAQQQFVDDVQRASEDDRGVVMAQGLTDLSQRFGDPAAAQAYAMLAKAEPKLAAQATANFYVDENTPPDKAWTLDPTHTPEGMQATEKLFTRGLDTVHRLMAAGQQAIGKLDTRTLDAFTTELSVQASKYWAPTLLSGITRDSLASGSEALARSLSRNAMATASTALGRDGDPQSGNWPDYLSMVGQVAKASPSAAREVFNFTQSHALGKAAAGNAALEATLQAFASDGGGLPRRSEQRQLTPSYLPFMQALLAPSAAQGALSASDALQVFETVCNSQEDFRGVSLLEQGNKKGGSQGTAQMADLYSRYMPAWVAPQFTAKAGGGYTQGPSLIAASTTGTLNDRFDQCFSNFMREAMFDPNEAGPYRQKLLANELGFISDLNNGKLAGTMSSEARGRLTGNLVGLINQGFDKYAADAREDGETKKALANFAIGLGFAFVSGPEGKVAEVLFSQGLDQGKGLAEDAIGQLVDAGVERKIAAGAVAAARSGDLLGALNQLNFKGEAGQRVQEYVNQQRTSFENGNLSLGELLLQIFADPKITGNGEFSEGLKSGWEQVKDRNSRPGG